MVFLSEKELMNPKWYIIYSTWIHMEPLLQNKSTAMAKGNDIHNIKGLRVIPFLLFDEWINYVNILLYNFCVNESVKTLPTRSLQILFKFVLNLVVTMPCFENKN